MKIKNNDIVFLIRTYNEGKRIAEVIDGIIEAWFDNILVVDDGSTDNTKKKLNKFNNLIYLKHPFNRWGWAALETGLEYIRYNHKKLGFNYVVTFDADGQHDIKDINHFVKAFEKHENLDIVLGSRFIKKTHSNVPFLRKLILMWWRFFTYMISHIYLTDSHNGYRMIKASSLKNIHLTMDGMEYASELIEQIRIFKLKYKEVPVNIKYDEYTLSKWQKNGNAINIALKMIWSRFFK